MGEFSSHWLSLREPVDHAARSEAVLSAMAHYFLNDHALFITDMGCGTGSTIRAIKPFVSQSICWHLVDNDDALLSEAKKSLSGDTMNFTLADLSKSLDPLFAEEMSLLATSAFLDLVSLDWLEHFVTETTSRQIPVYAALTYDGRAGCSPSHPTDTAVLEAFNRHQHTDKGLGPALGPDAAKTALDLFARAGYEVITETSDWVANRNHFEFQAELLKGWHHAAVEMEPEQKTDFDEWLSFRNEAINSRDHSLFVGHADFFAAPK